MGASYGCDVTSDVTVSGNWWVDCPSEFKVRNSAAVTFNGNVVFDGNVTVQGELKINPGNGSSTLPSACTPAGGVVIPCISSSSQEAAIVWMRNGTFDTNANGKTTFQHVSFFMQSGTFGGNGGTALSWTAPTAGPFKGLSLWAETPGAYTLNGGGGLNLSGVFFTPAATPFTVSGGGDANNPLAAQFIAYDLVITGGGTLFLVPDPDNQVSVPAKAGILIR